MKIKFEKSIKISGNSAKNLIYMSQSKEYIYFSQLNSKNIIGLNRKIQNEIKIATEDFLGPLSFDAKEEVFWASNLEENPKIYKINLNGETILELDVLKIIPEEYIINEKKLIIGSLTINNESNKILISIKETNHIYVLDKSGVFEKAILNLNIEEITDMKLLQDKLFINCKNKIYLFNDKFKIFMSENLDYQEEFDLRYTNMNSFIITKVNEKAYKILFLLLFRNEKHLCSGTLTVEKNFSPNITVNPISTPVSSNVPTSNITLPNSSISGMPFSTISTPNDIKQNNIYKIIELIAKEEAALVDLIKTQGKTLKNVMQNNNNIDDLISINKSLNLVLDKIVKVEIGLTNKLKEAEKIAEKSINN